MYKGVPAGSGPPDGTQELAVPPARGGRATGLEFAHTFTSDDAAVGKVTFRAVAD